MEGRVWYIGVRSKLGIWTGISSRGGMGYSRFSQMDSASGAEWQTGAGMIKRTFYYQAQRPGSSPNLRRVINQVNK